jgi:tetratricopeptide (TPR) repeat protein
VRDAPDAELESAVTRVHGIPRALELIFTTLDRDPGRSLDDALGRFYTDETVVSELLARGYEGLDADPQGADLRRVLQALAVFDAPVDLDAITFLLEPFAPPIDIPGAVSRLGRIHLVEVDRRTATNAMSAIDQDYVYSQIPVAGAFSVSALERRAADYFASIRRPPAEWRTTDGLDPQLREFDHRLRAGDPDGASAVLAGFEVDDLVWRGKGELARWYREQLEGKLTDERQLALHAYAVGHIRLVLGPLDSALQHLEDARGRANRLGDERLEADALNASGEALRRLGRLTEAADRLRDAIPMFGRLHHADDESSARLSLSLTAAYLGDGRGALEEGERALAMAETSGDARMRARADDSLSLAYLVLGDLEAALAHADASARAYVEAGQPEPLGYVVNVRGMVLLAQGRAADAAVEFERVDKAGAEVQQPRISGLGLFNLARARRVLGDVSGAWDAARGAEAALQAVGSSEAAAASSLARALKASIDDDAATEIRELLACAVASATSADLHPPLDLAEEAARRATEVGTAAAAKDVRRDARALAKALKARLVRPT